MTGWDERQMAVARDTIERAVTQAILTTIDLAAKAATGGCPDNEPGEYARGRLEAGRDVLELLKVFAKDAPNG